MILFEEAFKIVMEHVFETAPEEIGIGHSLRRVLAEDITSDMDMPPFNKSTMDGYACRKEDLGENLAVIETIPAGYVPQKTIGKYQCSKIMTGAIVPEGANIVIIVEQTETISDNTVRFTGNESEANICSKGEYFREGDILLHKGDRISPQHMAVLASTGHTKLKVFSRPIVGVIATGDELVEPNKKPDISQIRNSNSQQTVGQITETGCIPKYYGIIRDNEKDIGAILKIAIKECNVIIFSGGVSMGEFDLVPKVIENNGIKILFDRVAIKPGKPTTFGVSPQNIFIGLPGNPVSGFVIFELLVKPMLYKMMGHEYTPRCIFLPMDMPYQRKNAIRKEWIPVTITNENRVRLIEYHGSAHISSFCDADGLISIPVGENLIEQDSIVQVMYI